VRLPKVKPKISGGFRTTEGLATSRVIRSCLATLPKQGINVFGALVNTLKGDPVQPNLTAG